MEWKVQVRFIKAMYPYKQWDIGFVYPMILEKYPDFVEEYSEKETVKTKKEVSKPVAEKQIEKPIADKAMKKKSTK